MGNEQSQLAGLEIDEKAVEVSDFWSQHSASVVNSEFVTNLSVLVGELFVSGPLWSQQTPLEKNSKNLMIYRHPCIVKYISSWKRGSKIYLALEEVKPLSHVLSSLSTLQICIGLHSILKALCFLHEKAQVSHNNVCISSIYFTKDGSWKLGGMEYLCRYANLSSDYLNKSRSTRYSKAIDSNEDKHFQSSTSQKDVIDAFAYGVLVCEVLRNKTDDEIQSLKSFRDLCKNGLQNIDILKRPKLADLLGQDFFNHDFIAIHSFLVELPLKTDEEKTNFFVDLCDRLKNFDEITVGHQLGGLLLSRMVLLNNTAQTVLLPVILCPRQDSDCDEQNSGLFSEDVFRKYIVPKLLEIFCVRDAQIRLLLLDHFKNFIHTFTKEELQSLVLPELLVGIKDTNDQLVSATLRILADLILILGSATVIGGKRAKLFNDGRPITHPGRRSRKNSKRLDLPSTSDHLLTTPVVENEIIVFSQETASNDIAELPERPRPDGEEGETSTEEVEQSVEEDLDNWEDWDINENQSGPDNTQNLASNISLSIDNLGDINSNNSNSLEAVQVIGDLSTQSIALASSNTAIRSVKNVIPDITELDIKNQVNLNSPGDEEFNFFQDMEPVIESSSKFVIDREDDSSLVSSKLNLSVNLETHEDGWVDEDW